jgi:hypothetical protein
MSTSNGGDAPLFQVRNHHSATSGPPPHIDDVRTNQYLGYFENQYGEQALFVDDRDSSQAILYLGDAGWDIPHPVVDRAVPDLVLSEIERLWVRACCQAATANRKEA